VTGKIDCNTIQDNGMKKLKVSIKTFGCQMETDRDDSCSKDAEYVWS